MKKDNKFGLSPDPASVDRIKARFLAAYDAKYGTRPTPAGNGGLAAIFKIGIGVLAAIAVVAGATVYADTANVGVASSFYSFKRLGEKVQLAFTPATSKPELQASFAMRRMDELNTVQNNNADANVVTGLNADLNNDVKASLAAEMTIDPSANNNADFCARFLSSIGSTSSSIHDALLRHPRVIQRFEEQCVQGATSTTGYDY